MHLSMTALRKSLSIPSLATGVCLFALAGAAGGCVNVRTAPIRVEPVYIKVDVNLRVARELDGFFGDLDRREEALIRGTEAPVSTQPKATP